jgi:archaellin
VFGDNDDERDTPSLQGTWRVTILPGAPNQFLSLMEFNEGGTMTEANSIAANTTSIGVWKKIRGHRKFATTFELFFDSDSDGVIDSRYRVRTTIHLTDDDTFTGTFTLDVLTLDGTTQVAGPIPGLPLEGRRMKVMRE